MFCEKCGAKLNAGDSFCYNCGNTVNANKQLYVDDKVIYNIKPQFNIGYQIFRLLKYGIFAFILLLIFLDGFFDFAQSNILLVVVIYFIIALLVLIVTKKQYDNLEYKFYADKMEYADSFINKENKELKYKNIKEIIMRQNIFEKLCGIGTIIIATSASSGYASKGSHYTMRNRNGIHIHCVTNVQFNYQNIKNLIDKA